LNQRFRLSQMNPCFRLSLKFLKNQQNLMCLKFLRFRLNQHFHLSLTNQQSLKFQKFLRFRLNLRFHLSLMNQQNQKFLKNQQSLMCLMNRLNQCFRLSLTNQ
jgi:hypothetical protein